MPATVNRTTLKGYFDPGDEPTSVQFQTFIDSAASTNESNFYSASQHVNSNVHVTGSLRMGSGGINIVPESLSPAASVTLTAAQAGKLLLIPSVSTANDEYVLPTPTFLGQTYNVAWSGIAADGDDVLFVASSADAITFTGGILQFDTDATDASGYTIAFPGADDDKLTIVNPESFDLTFTATTLTNYHVRGYAMSTDTAVAFGDL
ncbi:hypothetical protein [uncultured virus]|uniref:Uncharacterized protein n=1 Tax=uncultured virus TaxID=340016 RepID=A0A218MMM6_9VIRU|nr:hypothetical protein [uncultured virus]